MPSLNQHDSSSGGGGGGVVGALPPPPPEPEPEEEEKTPRQICLEGNQRAKQVKARCNAQGSANYGTFLQDVCLGGGTVTISAGAIVTGSVSVNVYEQCRDRGLVLRNNHNDSCQVSFTDQTKVCPGD
jgi:hypothetical protein